MADIVRKKRERPSDNEAEGDLDANKAKRVKLADPAVLWQGYVGMETELNIHTLKRQNREIFAKLKEQYFRITEVEKECARLTDRDQRRSAHLLSCTHFIEQLLASVQTQIELLAPASQEENRVDCTALVEALVKSLYNNETDTAKETDEVHATLERYRQQSQSLIAGLTKAIESTKNDCNNLRATLATQASQSDQASALQRELEKANAEIASLRRQNAELIARERQQSSSVASLRAQLTATVAKYESCKKEKSELENMYAELERSAERMRIELHYLSTTKSAATTSNGNMTRAPADGNATSVAAGPASQSAAPEEVEKYKREAEEYRIVADTRQAAIDKLTEEKQELIRRISELEEKVADAVHKGMSDLMKTQEFAHQDRARQLAEASLQRATEQLQELQRQLEDLRAHVNARSEVAREHVSAQLAAVQQERDELLKKLRAAEDDRERAKRKLEELSKTVFDKRILEDAQQSLAREQAHHKKLKQEYEKLKEETDSLRKELSKYTGSESATLVDQLKDKDREIQLLNQKAESFLARLSEWEEKEKAWNAKAREMDIVIKTYMSTKTVTENDFVQLKAQERLWQEEREKLNAELAQERAKNADGVNKELQQQISALQAQIKELQLQAEKATKKSEEYNRLYQATKRESHERLSEIELITKECEELQEQNTKLSTLLTEKEDTNARLVAEQIKAQQAQQIAKTLKEMYQDKVAQLEAKLNAQTELLKACQRKQQLAEEELRKALEESAAWSKIVEESKRAVASTSVAFDGIAAQMAVLQAELKELRQACNKHKLECENERQKNIKLTEELTVAQHRLKRFGGKPGLKDSQDSLVYQELQLYKQFYYCSLCKANRVDTILVSCNHVFCRECVDKNLKARSRKCPGCSASFSVSDVHPVYFS